MNYYTPKEARKTLPLVRKIVEDIMMVGRDLRAISSEYDGNIEENSDYVAIRDQMKEYLKELEDLNCYYKDWQFTIGLVDFPALVNGVEVSLCWKSDEDDITYYHNTDEGFYARRPIPQEWFE